MSNRVKQRDDRRAQELNNLKLELAAFAVRLAAFEARMKESATTINGHHQTAPVVRLVPTPEFVSDD